MRLNHERFWTVLFSWHHLNMFFFTVGFFFKKSSHGFGKGCKYQSLQNLEIFEQH